MTDVNFIELASYCQNRYKEEHNSKEDRYVKTLFIAITKEGKVITSTTPHILGDAEQCILIHEVCIRRNVWFKVEFINKEGAVYEERLDDKFRLYIKYNDLIIWLKHEDKIIYSCQAPWEKNIPKVWKLYSRIKDVKSSEEICLIADLYKKDEKILELEKQIENFKFTNYLLEQERNQYKSMLDKLAKMIESQ